MSYESNRELLLGTSGEHAEEYAVELGIRERLLSELQQSGKASQATITFRPNQRAVVFQIVQHEGRTYWHAYEGEAQIAHKYFEELISHE